MATGGYWALKAIADDQRAWARTYYALPPDACPRCGQPLDVGQQSQPGGGKQQIRHCNAGHYQWTGGQRET